MTVEFSFKDIVSHMPATWDENRIVEMIENNDSQTIQDFVTHMKEDNRLFSYEEDKRLVPVDGNEESVFLAFENGTIITSNQP